jgi:signal peptide peptidase SppA
MSDRLRSSYEHVLSFAYEHPWAITHSMRGIVAGILARRIAGHDADPAELAALVNRSALPQPKKGGTVALIPIYGVIAPRMNMLSDISGGTTFEALTGQLHDAMANDAIKTIIFDVDSPGGNVAGATEFAGEVLKARKTKPIIAVAQYLMASAAYWPMSCATKVYAAPSAMVGSIGVYHIHDDISEALKREGVERTVISAGKYKAEAAPGSLSPEAREHIQGLIDANYDNFVTDIANGRGVKADAVRRGYGEGRCLTAADALALGMIDRIATLADTLASVMTTAPSAGLRAHTDSSQLATDQEPLTAATSQEPVTDAQWQNAIDGALLSLDF